MAEYIPPAPWDEDGKFWDEIEIKGKVWPGKATVDVVRANKWDTKKAKGKHGGEREFNGADLAKVKIQIVCWETEQTILLVELLPDIEPTPGKEKPDAVSISHPVAIIRKCPNVTIDNVASKVTDRMMVIDIDATEHRPPEAKNASGTASGKGSFNPKNTSSCDDLRFQLNNLYARNIALAQAKASNKLHQEAAEFDPNGISGDLGSLQAEYAQLDAEHNEVADQIVRTIEQQNALKCSSAPSSDSATTQP